MLAALAVACSSADLTPSVPPQSTPDGTGTSSSGGSSGGGGDGGPGDPGAPLAMSSNVTIQVEPSDSGAALLAAIKGAKESVHVTMYLLTSSEMISALTNLKAAGKEVKVVLNQNFPTLDNANATTFTTLKNKGVSVVWASNGYTFTHAKTIVIDGSKAIISTMNLTYSSPTSNREYIATDTDAQDVADLEKIFAADFDGKAVSLPSKLVISPASANTLQSPRDKLKRLIASATKTLDVEVESLSDDGIVDAIVAAHQAKVDVRVVVDSQTLSTPAQTDAVTKLNQAGVPLHGVKTPDIHAKAIVADAARVYVGSQNFTVTALEANREIGVLTDAPGEAKKVSDVIRGDFDNGSGL